MTDITSAAGPIAFERIIDATPDEAFALFTRPERLRRWLAVSASVDLRAGGDYRITVGPGHVACGTMTEIEPGKRLVYTWGWDGAASPPPGGSTIIVEFEPAGDKTLVRMTHAGLTAEQGASHSEGWNHYLDRLADAASSGDAGADPWATGGDELDHLTAAEASWAICQQVMVSFTRDDRERPTPCSEYTVHDLVEHLMGSLRGLGGIAGAEIPDEIEADSAEDYIAQAAEPALAAWRSRGVDGEVPFAGGQAPAALPAGILSLEFFVHAWDFARATDQPFSAPAPLTAYVTTIAEQTIQPDFRGEGKGFAEIADPADDAAVTRLMAFTGRAT
jgi:uncharacterized protein (TIGR03086 family)